MMQRGWNIGVVILLAACLCGAVSAAGDKVTVADVSITPAIFLPGDTGTIQVTVANNGTTGVSVARAVLYADALQVKNDQTYASVGTIGAGNSMVFTYSVTAGDETGTFFPAFYMDFRDGGALQYGFPVQIDGTEPVVSVSDIPDSFPVNRTETLTVTVGNPRKNTINSVSIEVGGEGATAQQSGYFIGTLGPDATETVDIEVDVERPTTLLINVSYRNGDNYHSNGVSLPVTTDPGKKQAAPIVNNVAVTPYGAGYQVEGDVTNAGLEDAYAIVVTTSAPGVPVDPYRSYVVGTLEPGDPSSFEVTFTAKNPDEVPLLVTYKDRDGNPREFFYNLDDSSAGALRTTTDKSYGFGGGGFGNSGSEDGGIPWIPVFIVLIVIVGGVVAWRKGYLTSLAARLKGKRH